MTVRMKVKCCGVKTSEGTWNGKPSINREIEFYFVSGDESEENKKFWEASPYGTFKVMIYNPNAANELQLGKFYYVDVHEAK